MKFKETLDWIVDGIEGFRSTEKHSHYKLRELAWFIGMFFLLSWPALICLLFVQQGDIVYTDFKGALEGSSYWVTVGALAEAFWITLVFPFYAPKEESK